MAFELKMPALSPTMEKGTLARWLVVEGDTVRIGDMIAEVETDKATMEIEADFEGSVSAIAVPAGTEDVPVGTVIARMAAEGDALSNQDAAVPEQAEAAEVEGVSIPAPAQVAPAPPVAAVEVVTTAPAPAINRSVNATPLARRIAAIRNVALESVSGTGPNGKIVKADLGIESLLQRAPVVPEKAVTTAIPPPPDGVPVTSHKLSSMRKTIARRLTESKTSVPHFYLTARCRLDALLALRTDLNGSLAARGVKLSVNDLLLKAMAIALVRVPEANVQFGGDVLHRFDRVDISMAVAIDGGLITPVVRDAATKSLSAIAEETKSLAEKARNGRLLPEDYAGGTASISNLGMFGIDEMVPVINPPQALIMGVGAGIRQPWDVDGEIALATILAATASFDHRAIDGAIAAQFMSSFRELLEEPMTIIA